MSTSDGSERLIDANAVWRRIETHAGQPFRQIRGKVFTYAVTGGAAIEPSTTRWKIPKSHVVRALDFVPLVDTVPLQHLMGPSYLYAILTDTRIRQGEW